MNVKNLVVTIGLLIGGIATSAIAGTTFYNTGVDDSGKPLSGARQIRITPFPLAQRQEAPSC